MKLGLYTYKVDDKNRFTVSKKKFSDTTFYIIACFRKFYLVPQKALPQFNKHLPDHLVLATVTRDGIGRILIPKQILDLMRIDSKITLNGLSGGYFRFLRDEDLNDHLGPLPRKAR